MLKIHLHRSQLTSKTLQTKPKLKFVIFSNSKIQDLNWFRTSIKLCKPEGTGFYSIKMKWSRWRICIYMLVQLFIFKPVFTNFSSIEFLPGFSGPLPFKLETGYIGVDENEDVQLFYYFVESEGNPHDDPLVLWLTGGPGCSAFSGLAFEIGPLQFNIVEYNGSLPTLALNPHSWTKVSNIIFLDAPAGTGFSYSRTWEGYGTSDTRYAAQTCSFLRKWLLSHPEFIENPVYIAGDSYSGMVVPVITKDLIEGIDSGTEPRINLKGYLLGNPATDVMFDGNSKVPFVHRMGLISDELYKSAKRNCRGDYVNVKQENCAEDLRTITECIEKVRDNHILEPRCIMPGQNHNTPRAQRFLLEKAGELILVPASLPHFGCREYNSLLLNIWANDVSVQKALNARKGELRGWIRCNRTIYAHHVKDVRSAVSYHQFINSRGYRALIYSGDHDMMIPYLGTLAWIKSLNLSIVESWRPWLLEGQVAGYTRSYENELTFATIKGGGHTAPEFTPKECFAMFKRWISEEPL